MKGISVATYKKPIEAALTNNDYHPRPSSTPQKSSS